MSRTFFEFPKPTPKPFFNADNPEQQAVNALYAPYEAVMKDYQHHAEDGRWQFLNRAGYKFHLNVKPINVLEVANYLLDSDFEHKYLDGGAVEDGKIFTVAGGSKVQTEGIVRQIADSFVSRLLEPPLTLKYGEVLFAPNIAGRFTGNRRDFHGKQTINGITILRNSEKFDPSKAFDLANKELLRKYGEYYGGGITFYQPKVISEAGGH